MIWTIVITAIATLLLVVIAMNFATPEKKLERKIEHRYSVADPQFKPEDRGVGEDQHPVDKRESPGADRIVKWDQVASPFVLKFFNCS